MSHVDKTNSCTMREICHSWTYSFGLAPTSHLQLSERAYGQLKSSSYSDMYAKYFVRDMYAVIKKRKKVVPSFQMQKEYSNFNRVLNNRSWLSLKTITIIFSTFCDEPNSGNPENGRLSKEKETVYNPCLMCSEISFKNTKMEQLLKFLKTDKRHVSDHQS